jgi:hypothetical protein
VRAPNPVAFQIAFRPGAGGLEAQARFGLQSGDTSLGMSGPHVRVAPDAEWRDQLRLLGDGTLVGRWMMPDLPEGLLRPLEPFVSWQPGRFTCQFVAFRE